MRGRCLHAVCSFVFPPTFFDTHLVGFLFVFCLGVFLVFWGFFVFVFQKKKHENFLANLWMIFILKF